MKRINEKKQTITTLFWAEIKWTSYFVQKSVRRRFFNYFNNLLHLCRTCSSRDLPPPFFFIFICSTRRCTWKVWIILVFDFLFKTWNDITIKKKKKNLIFLKISFLGEIFFHLMFFPWQIKTEKLWPICLFSNFYK